MALLLFFIINAVVAGWISDQDPTTFARVTAYESWLIVEQTAGAAEISQRTSVVDFDARWQAIAREYGTGWRGRSAGG